MLLTVVNGCMDVCLVIVVLLGALLAEVILMHVVEHYFKKEQ